MEQCADSPPGGFDGSFSGLAQQGFKLCKDLFDRIEVRAVGRQKEQLGACRANGAAYGLPLVTSEIVHDDNVSGLERRHQYLFDIGEEGLPIDWTVDDAWRLDSIAAERSQKSERLPVAVRNLRHQPYTARQRP